MTKTWLTHDPSPAFFLLLTFLHVSRSTFSLYHDTIKSICNDCFTFCLLLWKSLSPKLAPKLHWVFSIVWKKHNASRARRNPYMNVWKMRRSLKTARHNGMLIICVNILNWTWEHAFEELEPISNFCFLTRFSYTLSIIVRHNSWRQILLFVALVVVIILRSAGPPSNAFVAK